MSELSIGQLAEMADVNASTLRYYESVGLLPFPERKNGQRRYNERLLERIHFIKIAQQTGFSIQEISVLLEGFEPGDSLSGQWEKMAKQKISCGPINDYGWGLLSELKLPGGGKIGVYEPRHARPKPMTVKKTKGKTKQSSKKSLLRKNV